MNRLKRQVDETGATTRMGYDLAGNLIWSDDGNNNHYAYEYDFLSRRTAMIYPDQTRESNHYDVAGNMDAYTNRAGNVQTFFYDNRNRQTGFDWNDGVTPQQRTIYDPASRVTQIWNWDATINYTYWDNNLLKTEQVLTGSNYNHTLSYVYDADGNRQTLTCPSGAVWQYAYTARNQLMGIANANGVGLVSYQYDLAGNRVQRSLYNGTVTDYGPVDALNRSPWVRHRFNGAEAGRFDYAFDGLSRLQYEQRNGGTADGYGFNKRSEVTGYKRDGTLSNGVVSGGVEDASYIYDPAGNRQTVTNNGTVTAWSVNNLNEYTQIGGASPTSDVKGNVQTYNG